MSDPLPQLARVQRSKTSAARNYDRLSRSYDLIAGSSEKKFWILGSSKLNPLPGERILEIGCGTGGGLCRMVLEIRE